MPLTTSQLQALKAAALADPTASAFLAAGNDTELGWWFNAEASPAFYVWDSNYTSDKLRRAINNGITQLDALTASKRDSLLWWAGGTHDMGQSAARAAADDLTGSQNTLKAAVLDGAKLKARVVEKVLATGTGSFASPAVAGFTGALSLTDIAEIRVA
jgi:hypothetical protein